MKRKKEPRALVAARQRRFKKRKKIRHLYGETNPLHLQLTGYYESSCISPRDWILAKEFYSNSAFAGFTALEDFERDLKRDRNIETTFLYRPDSLNILLVRPRWAVVEGKELIENGKPK